MFGAGDNKTSAHGKHGLIISYVYCVYLHGIPCLHNMEASHIISTIILNSALQSMVISTGDIKDMCMLKMNYQQ